MEINTQEFKIRRNDAVIGVRRDHRNTFSKIPSILFTAMLSEE